MTKKGRRILLTAMLFALLICIAAMWTKKPGNKGAVSEGMSNDYKSIINKAYLQDINRAYSFDNPGGFSFSIGRYNNVCFIISKLDTGFDVNVGKITVTGTGNNLLNNLSLTYVLKFALVDFYYRANAPHHIDAIQIKATGAVSIVEHTADQLIVAASATKTGIYFNKNLNSDFYFESVKMGSSYPLLIMIFQRHRNLYCTIAFNEQNATTVNPDFLKNLFARSSL